MKLTLISWNGSSDSHRARADLEESHGQTLGKDQLNIVAADKALRDKAYVAGASVAPITGSPSCRSVVPYWLAARLRGPCHRRNKRTARRYGFMVPFEAWKTMQRARIKGVRL